MENHPPAPDPVTLNEDDDLALLFVDHPGSDTLVVTFGPRLLSPLQGPANLSHAFGHSFFNKEKIPALHLVAKWNHWWAPTCMSRVMPILQDHFHQRRVWTYGSSMGGHGALRYAGPLNASGVIALIPQATVDLQHAAFDPRWMGDRKMMTPEPESWLDHSRLPDETYVFYDNFFALDRKHVEMISDANPHIKTIPVPFGEHAVPRMVLECGLLSQSLLRLIQGRFDPADFKRTMRDQRKNSLAAWMGASAALRSRSPKKRSLALKCSARAMLILDQIKRSNAGIDAAVARRAIVEHATNLFQTGSFKSLGEFIALHEPAPIVNVDLRRISLQYAMTQKDGELFSRMLDSLFRSDGITPGSVGALIRGLLDGWLSPSPLHETWGGQIIQSSAADLAARYETAVRSRLSPIS
jgi:hypothetical protein